MHDVSFGMFKYDPGRQGRQVIDPTDGVKYPAWHGVQVVSPSVDGRDASSARLSQIVPGAQEPVSEQ